MLHNAVHSTLQIRLWRVDHFGYLFARALASRVFKGVHSSVLRIYSEQHTTQVLGCSERTADPQMIGRLVLSGIHRSEPVFSLRKRKSWTGECNAGCV